MRNDYNGKKRSELPDSVFGIPQERKYPMPDEKHTRSAIKLFNHVEPKYEEQLAKAIIKNMKKYNIDGSVVGPNNRLRKYLPKDMIKESILLEGLLKSDKDIYYNKDKFDSGEINLCFITGLSGSGKSTMGRGMTSKNIEHYEMDDVICNDNFSDSNLKEYGGLIESFFKGSGKSFRLLRDDDSHNNNVFKSHKNYEKEITQAFVKHALSYCKSHKNTKFICDGIWVFMFINPSQLKDCAVYIKGTSSIKSGYRALKRDIDEDKRNGMTSLQIFKHEFKRVKEDVLYAKENQKELKSFRSYFEKQSTNESVSSTVSKDHKQKGHIKLSSLKKVRITEYLIDKYKKEYPILRHVRCKDTDEYVCDGYMWFKDDNLVCYVGSCQYTDDNTKWIVSLEILPEYRGYGLSNQILDFCVKSMKCRYLSVGKTNKLAKKIYDKYGFKVYYEDKTMYYMTLDNISKNESYTLNEMYTPQETGISTIIFDIGDVLVSSNFRDCLLQDPEIPNNIVDELINLWVVDKDNIDDTLTLDTYREIVIKRLGPDFSKYITALIRDNVDCVLAFDYTVPLIQDLKNRGYKVYYLSNWSSWTHDLLLQAGKFDFLKLMDGGVFSYDVGCRKPDPEIYEVLLKKYNINPKESIFFDDKEKNIKTANKLGINGVVFYNHDPFIVYKALSKKSAYSESSITNNSITEYGTTTGTMVGTNQPDSVYIVNYMQNNVFSGHKESKFGICKKGMKDLHVVGGKHNKFHYVSDLDKFKDEVSDIHVYRYKGKPKNEFYDIIENMDDDDLKIYELVTGKTIDDRSMIKFDGDFIEEECFFDEIEAIKACTEAGLLEAATDLHIVPILTVSVKGRPYNYYRDINGVFIQNEITKLRSKSYDSIDEIPNSESVLVKRGYLV